MQRDIGFALSGDVNGVKFEMNGTGVGNTADGTCELHLKAVPAFPVGFDPVSCPLICSHPTSTYFAKELAAGSSFRATASEQYAVSPAREGVLRTAKGEEVLRLSVIGETYVNDGGVLVSMNFMSGMSHLPAMKRNVTPLKDYILPAGKGRATGIIRYTMEARNGDELSGMTVVPYVWDADTALDEPLVRLVDSIHVDYTGGNEVHAFYKVRIVRVSKIHVIEEAVSRLLA
jgi:hypothetical protein